MPATMQREQTCCICRERKPRHKFSVANGICLTCFDRSYAFCEECGVVVYRANISRSRYGCAFVHDGQTLCVDCAYTRTGARQSDSSWRPQPLGVSVATYDRVKSKRKYGVEIETSRCANYERLAGRTKFGAKADCSVSGMEFDSPIMYGDEGFEHIEEILAYGAVNGWRVDSDCGCHTHYDMRDENFDQLCSILYAYSKTSALWERFVPNRRSSCSYSHGLTWEASTVVQAASRCDSFEGVTRYLGCDRYSMVNFQAYYSHRTFEVRMLEGSVDPKVICDWISICARFIDAVRDMTFAEIDDWFGDEVESQFDGLANIIGDDDLINWLLSRANEFRRPILREQPE